MKGKAEGQSKEGGLKNKTKPEGKMYWMFTRKLDRELQTGIKQARVESQKKKK